MDIDLSNDRQAANTRKLVEQEIDFGTRLKRQRTARDLTLEALSQRSGVAQSTLSKIERRELSPSLTTLQRIARGLQMPISSLLGSEEPTVSSGRRTVTREFGGEHLRTGPCDHVWLCSDLSGKRMLPFHTTILARSPDDYPEWAYHEGEIFLHVLEGVMVFYSEFYKPLRLEKSDCLYYDGTMRHVWTSEGEQDAKAVWVFTPSA